MDWTSQNREPEQIHPPSEMVLQAFTTATKAWLVERDISYGMVKESINSKDAYSEVL